MDIVFKMIMLLDHENNWDEKTNNCVAQAGEAMRGPLVFYTIFNYVYDNASVLT